MEVRKCCAAEGFRSVDADTEYANCAGLEVGGSLSRVAVVVDIITLETVNGIQHVASAALRQARDHLEEATTLLLSGAK